ncbi:Lar family restriction alleviation protein [Pseudomonas sp. LS.1a]|uniref:Lar family restriction alleviation protein n=1 Tax=Pseudomonas sp. LS.1a TaxID=2920387 RepID=UPI001F13819E|nr:Lar family restriction alleviation protein [Pseudomonas sp. LS.1a]UMY64012.1 Lar family restriction alleviation protein [Pseudomonas sp. LS.1a]
MQNVKFHLQDGFKRPRLDLVQCPVCRGRAVVKGVFYELACMDCNGSGWVVEGSRLVLSLEELVTQLSFKLEQSQRQIEALKRPAKVVGPQQQYQEPNRVGAGGTNYTGD